MNQRRGVRNGGLLQTVIWFAVALGLMGGQPVWAHDGMDVEQNQRQFLPIIMGPGILVATATEQLTGEFTLWVEEEHPTHVDYFQYTITTDAGAIIPIELPADMALDNFYFDGKRVMVTGRWTGYTSTLLDDGSSANAFAVDEIVTLDESPEAVDEWLAATTMLAAAAAPAPASLAPDVAGQWSDVVAWPDVAVHASLLPNGKVLFWSVSRNTAFSGPTYTWDPATDEVAVFLNPTTNLFCSGHALLPNGNLFASGGHEIKNGYGSKNTNFYLYESDTWVLGPGVTNGRWYPSVCALGNGEMLSVGGSYFDRGVKKQNPLAQVYQQDGAWRDLTNTLKKIQGPYPWTFLAPDGRVFVAGPRGVPGWLDTAGSGAWKNGPRSKYGNRSQGAAIMYDVGKIMIVGGGGPTNTAEVIDLNAPTPTWRYVNNMHYARKYLQTTSLPDGKVLVTSGTTAAGNDARGAVLAAEVWDPATEQWTVMASMNLPRLYHTTALLLPDGRVMVAGGGKPTPAYGVDQLNMELYSPPYLFQGPRPTIQTAPEVITYQEEFIVETPEAANITKVSLIRLGSMTHTLNMNQRYLALAYQQDSESSIKIMAPAHGSIAPPGHYMLFLIDQNGVPSIAPIVQLQ